MISFKRNLMLFMFLFITAGYVKAQDPMRFGSEINAFKKSDQSSPPPSGCVLFVGSSSIRFWQSLASDFPDYFVINRGFGGSEISDVNYFFKDIVAPYHPQIIVLYAGDNDLADHKTPEEVLSDLKKFTSMVSGNIPILFISAKPSPSRWMLKEEYEKFNALAKKFCESTPNMHFIDIFNPMLGPDGKPIPSLYRQDSLHMTPPGYRIWTSRIDPLLKKYYEPAKVSKK